MLMMMAENDSLLDEFDALNMALDRRESDRINGCFKIGYKTYCCDNQNMPLYVLPMEERKVNISATGIAFKVDIEPTDWVDFEVEILIEWPSREILVFKALHIRHVDEMPGWMAFKYTDIAPEHAEMIKGYVDVYIRMFRCTGSY
jgi:hypothetical protein